MPVVRQEPQHFVPDLRLLYAPDQLPPLRLFILDSRLCEE